MPFADVKLIKKPHIIQMMLAHIKQTDKVKRSRLVYDNLMTQKQRLNIWGVTGFICHGPVHNMVWGSLFGKTEESSKIILQP